MLKKRAIPCLLLSEGSLVKTTQFTKPIYVGDPVNSVKIFNEMQVDEIAVLDILATPSKKSPDFDLLQDLASECFMPLAYGGGIKDIETCRRLFSIGIEKVIINTAALLNPDLINAAVNEFGSQSIVMGIDVKKDKRMTPIVVGSSGKLTTEWQALPWALEVEKRGAGEIFLNSVDNDGMMNGYDLPLIHQISTAVKVPVIACGGAGTVSDLGNACKAGASAVGMGSLVVYQGKNRSVLINFPTVTELSRELTL